MAARPPLPRLRRLPLRRLRLGFLEVGHHPQRVRYHVHELGAGRDVLAPAHADFADLAIAGRVHHGVVQVDLGLAQLGLGHLDLGFERGAVHRRGLDLLGVDLDVGLGLGHVGGRQARGGTHLVTLVERDGAALGQRLHALQLGCGTVGFGLRRRQAGAAGAQRGAVLGLGLVGIGQLCAGIGQLGLGLCLGGFVGAGVDAHQGLARLDVLVVLHQHLGHIAADLGREHGDGAAHIGVVGADHGAREGEQVPGTQHQQHAGQCDHQHHQHAAQRGLDELGRWRWRG